MLDYFYFSLLTSRGTLGRMLAEPWGSAEPRLKITALRSSNATGSWYVSCLSAVSLPINCSR